MTDTFAPPIFFIAAAPNKELQVKNFFDSGDNGIKSLLQQPESIRRFGWNMETLDTPRLESGGFWLVQNGDRKIIRFYKYGLLIARGYATEDFLGWGTNKDEDKDHQYLNPLALIEFILEFIRLYKRLLINIDNDFDKIIYKFGFSNTGKDKRILQMHQGIWKLEPKFVSGDFSEQYEGRVVNGEFNSGEHAFKIIKIIFVYFGLEEKNIKYQVTNEATGNQEISADLFPQS